MPDPSAEIRERACDWLILGPIVGFTTDAEVRVLAQPFEKHQGMLELRIAEAVEGVRFDHARQGYGPVETLGPVRRFPVSEYGAYATAVFVVPGLDPDTRYFYEVVPEDAPLDVAGGFASRQPFSLRTLPRSPEAFKFSFHSCNGLHKPPRGGRPTDMWKRLLSEAVEDPELHFALLGGDQIYADVIREEWLREWGPDFDPSDPGRDQDLDAVDLARGMAFLEALPDRYERIYRAFWRRPELRTFMGHVPCLMTWDDHDIYDGWGSCGDEDKPAQRKFFEAAAGAFDAFQFALAPKEPLSEAARCEREGHRAFSFMVGEVAFVVLDLRSQRNINSRTPSAVLGERQWAWFAAELAELERRKPRQVVVVSAVPVSHISGAVEYLVPNSTELHDDIVDHWSSRSNRNDQARLLGKLFRLRQATGANVLLLSGDVHVGTVGEILCDDPRFLLDGESAARIHQGVSSAIAHEAPSGLTAHFVRYLVRGEHVLRNSFSGRVDEVVTARNFSIVSVQANGAFRFNLFREGAEVPDQYYFSTQGGGGWSQRTSPAQDLFGGSGRPS
ncbi:PhoD-like phosphatase [Enhygromyxa salina]|uniref:PhoD-like phosphatase n=1 Tax=Enhygromyxa salina TaxID=215803 RepID=A0A2S9YCH3_9BACT|nr:alkaline phosphatase D family protein [Enhygromyxa salina]PRQ02814.1 PhoD-like phosphatase [Enhygromyxa salina]